MSIGFLTIYVLATAVGRMLNEASHRMRRLAGGVGNQLLLAGSLRAAGEQTNGGDAWSG